MTVTSVFPRLEQLLPKVSKPIQYVGGEVGAVVKDWDSTTVRWALMYPDAYEVGLPNQGVQILYEVLNELPDVLAERTYAVWPDLEALMRDHGVPQFTVDAHRPVGEFDLFGVSFATELGYTNLLTALDLAGIRSWSRAATPRSTPSRSPTSSMRRCWATARRRSARSPRSCAPGRRPAHRADAMSCCCASRVPKACTCRASTTWTTCLTAGSSGSCPTGPTCRSGYASAPRWTSMRGHTPRSPWSRWPRRSTIGNMVEAGLEVTGFQEVGLLSLSSADHSEIGDICSGLADRYEGSNVSLSLPSTRVDAFNITLAEELSRGGRRTGLTFAPEGGSERIRRVINKMVSEEDLIRTVVTAYTNGWRQVKLYFMCGLPTETDDDVVQIARLAHDVIRAGRAATGSKDIRCTVSIGGFVPKPHTPFQWAAMAPPEVIDRRLRLLKQEINSDRSLGRAIGYRYHDGEPSLIEGLLSRGDRRVGAVIRRVWDKGGRFDGWSEHFSYERWVSACAEVLPEFGLDLDWFTTRERDQLEVLPWDHLDSGLDKDWLWQDWQDSKSEYEQDDCRWTPCFDCGVCPSMDTEIQIGPTGRKLLPLTPVNTGLKVPV